MHEVLDRSEYIIRIARIVFFDLLNKTIYIILKRPLQMNNIYKAKCAVICEEDKSMWCKLRTKKFILFLC